MKKKYITVNLILRNLFLMIVLCYSNLMSAQVVLENEVKITDLGLHFDGSKVGSTASNTGDSAPYDYFFGRNISAHGDCIKTYGNFVFMTWYRGGKADRHVMLTRYNTLTGTMATIEFPHRHTGYQNQYWIGESHNTIAIGVSPLDGTIHLLYDMHAYSASRPSNGSLANDYFRYSYSVKDAASLPDADFTLDKFVQNGTGGYKHLRMPGTAAQSEFVSLTYPRFFQNDGGELFMLMREGGNNNGMYKFIRYDTNTGDWGNFTDFNRLNARSQPGIDYNWGLYGDMKYVNGKFRIGFQRRSQNNDDKYLYQNGVYYAYSDDQTAATGWKNYKEEPFSLPLWDADFIKVMEPGDYVQTTQKDKVYIVGGFDWTVTENEDVHIISQVKDNEYNVTKNLHTYKPAGSTEFITSEDFAGGAALYTSGNSIFLIGLTSSKRIFIEKAEGGTNNFTRVYEATSGKTFDHGVVHIENGKVYYYLMEKKTGNAQPLYLQIIDLDIVPVDPKGPNNFTIQAKGETCEDMNNGKLIINGAATHNYLATINGVNYDFNKNKTIEGLSPGTYDLCIDVVGENFSHCYEITIEEALTLTGKISVSKQSAQVSVDSGEAPYTVVKNGQKLFETYQSNFSIAVNHGDNIQISSKEACQGEMLKTINLLENVKAYPNPTSGLFELYIPNSIETIHLEVYNIHSQLIVDKTFSVQAGKVQLNLEDKPKGVYFVKVNSKKPVFVKVIKK
ncbi:BNR-4 repeat-containing protein [Seonamhaeicola maritimus]|uniref:T9SS type A sorting domain-containing protein n=1 Tax=Seonamhaeicola maritimus TaxID=2591822 RepID=A0A5C7GMM4_9FLAO|nr:BNR-4 repeat-containing protein [Seonamhaeicola maritimus]TXG39535.1 T9SS type A sorting domain-containing protein [Seonamhaeicola maritimus]